MLANAITNHGCRNLSMDKRYCLITRRYTLSQFSLINS